MKQKNYKTAFKALLTSFLILNSWIALGQTANITGNVINTSGRQVEFATINIKGVKTTVADKNGNYSLKNIKPGTYKISASYIGYNQEIKNIEVIDGQTIIINFILTVKGQILQEVVVNENASNKFVRKETPYVSRLPLSNIENPQSYSTITSELIKEQVVTNFNDVFKNAPGIDKLWTSTGRGGDGAAYFSLRGFAVQPTLLNGIAGLTNGGLEVANIDRVEVIKGPSGTLFGSSLISYGGLINVVTKKPYEGFGGDFSYVSGTYGLNRISADINTQINDNLLFRMNSAYHYENSFQDAGFKKSLFVAPSLSYKASEKLSFDFSAEILNSEGTNPAMIFLDRAAPLLAKNLGELGYNNTLSFTTNDITLKTPTSTFQGLAKYKIANNWTSQTIYSRSAAKSNGYYSYLYETSRLAPNYPNISGVFTRFVSKQNADTYTTDIQQNFIGDFKLGKFRNRVVAGLDYFNRTNINNNTAYAVVGAVKLNGEDTGTLGLPSLESKFESFGVDKSILSQKVYSAYISNVFNFSPKLSAMLSGRMDVFNNRGVKTNPKDDYSQTAFSPKLGLVYQPVLNKMSVFANYMNGFRNVAPIIQGSITNTFRPEQANQLEAGVKLNILNDRITSTISYYDISVSDVVRQGNETAVGSGVFEYFQDGKNYSRGFEFEVIANPVNGLNVIAGYSNNSSKVEKTSSLEFIGRRPENAGPKNLANLWLSYNFRANKLNGFGLGLGGNYASENFIMNRATPGEFALPSYTVLNASASYQINKMAFSLKLDNLTDKDYYKGWSTVEAQRPRSVAVSINHKF